MNQNTPVPVYSRWKMAVNGVPYRPGTGAIVNMRFATKIGDKVVKGFTGDGSGAGIMYGEYEGTITLTEIFPPEGDYVSFRGLLMSGASNQITLTPQSLNTFDAIGPSIIFSMIGQTNVSGGNAVEQEATRELSFVYGYTDKGV